MSFEGHPAGENIVYLRQGIELIRELDDDQFTGGPEGPFRGGVGSQLRHCIDFYDCLLRGIEDGRIDYSHRERDPSVETRGAVAVQRMEKLIEKLEAITLQQLAMPLQVRSDLPGFGEGLPTWSGSTLHRELQFLVSHTIHHYALIVSLLTQQGFEPGPRFAEFGVAPSTLDHWKTAGQLAT